mmetsp:Transcript_10659/g.25424  ORF Transcript_10659/g.25424 Transcript_10659/m.25424 type:complete len:505 (+) Transcript_10659:240-1754(+)
MTVVTKGNTGRGRRSRQAKRLLLVGGSCLVLLLIGLLCFGGGIGGGTSSSHKQQDQLRSQKSRRTAGGGGGRRGGGGGRRRNRNPQNNNHRQYEAGSDERSRMIREELEAEFEDPENPDDENRFLDLILEGKAHLVGVDAEISERGGNNDDPDAPPGDGYYSGVYGQFCQVNFDIHKKDPASVPMFRDVMTNSPGCDDPYEFDLYKVASLARERDEVAKQNGDATPKALNLTAVAFHESRCGSTLVANAMIAMDPTKHRTYSESPPPVYVLRQLCGENYSRCSVEHAATVLRDTIYMMSRTDDEREERVFFKFQSISSKYIEIFTTAFPNVPWMYVYRDPVQVMMSHVKDDQTLSRANCVRTMHGPHGNDMHNIAKHHGYRDIRDLNRMEYCAAHLASLTESAVRNLNDMAIPVDYAKLPSMLWEEIFPKIWGRPLTQTEISNMEAVSGTYSKGRGNKKKDFKDDSQKKEQSASEEVRDAAEKFMKESFDQLKTFEAPLLLTDS